MLDRQFLIGTLTRVSVLLTFALAGCSTPAPHYQPSVVNAETLKKLPAQPMAVGTFSIRPGTPGATSIGLRGASMTSPFGSDYAAYLAEALRQELVLAGKLNASSKLEVSGVLLKNDISAAGVSTNSGEIEAHFVVKNNGELRYEATHRAELSWESSFFGAVAVPLAQRQYPLIVQQLMTKLVADPLFQAAIR